MDFVHGDPSTAKITENECAPNAVSKPVFDAAKRAFDIAAGSLLLLVLSPVMLLAAWLIRRQSPGPALFRQVRTGLGGRHFRIYKFRTMHCDADRGGPLITSADDPRITPVGRFLRGCKMDELPQLINVVRGDMSLVGPRPQVPLFVDQFPAEQRVIILSVRPGVTGPTQLRYRNEEMLLEGRADREQFYVEHIMPLKCELDVAYVLGRNVGVDARALAETAWLAVRGVALRVRRQPTHAVVRAAVAEEKTPTGG